MDGRNDKSQSPRQAVLAAQALAPIPSDRAIPGYRENLEPKV